MTREEALAGIRQEIAEQRDAAQHEPDSAKRDRKLRHSRSREGLAEEEAEAITAAIEQSVPCP